MLIELNIRYYPETDKSQSKCALIPPTPGGDPTQVGSQEDGEDLVVHYTAGGRPWLWEIEHEPKNEWQTSLPSLLYRDSRSWE